MPRFYFHITADTTFLDDSGLSFDDDQEAMKHARDLAAALIRSTGVTKGTIIVENEDSGGLFEVPLTYWSN